MYSIFACSMEEVKKAQDKDGSIVAEAMRIAKENNIDAAAMSLYREVFKIIDGVSIALGWQHTDQH